MDITGLERTFLGMANAVEKLAQQQVVSNEQLNESVREQMKEQEEGKQVLLDIAHASHQNTYQHILATIPYYDGTSGDVISWLERIEAACLYAKRDPRQEALGHSSGKVLDSILSVPSNQPWKTLKETLMRDYSEFKSPAHSCTYLENMTQGEDESLRLYVYRYTRAHRVVTGLAPKENMDPSRWTHFLSSINNTAITDKVLRSKSLPKNLDDAMSRAIQLEAGFQLSKGVNMARKINVMQAEINETKVVKDTRARSNICWGCGKIGHFYKDCRNPNKRQYRDKMKQKSMKFKWQMEGEKDLEEEPVDALVSQLIRRGDTYKGKYKKLENAVTTGNTITTTSRTKLVTVPKTTAEKTSTPTVKVPNSGQATSRIAKTSPQTSVMKVIPGKNRSKRTFPKGTKGTQVSGSNQYGPSENTRSQTKDRRKYATQTAVTSYEKVVVDATTSSSESESADEDVNQISNDEVSDDAQEQVSDGKNNDNRRKSR